jgi:para-aminobenzoate synthetase component 1
MAVLLDSAEFTAQGRYSYVAARPFRVVRAAPAPWRVTIDGQPVPHDPFTTIEKLLEDYRQDAGSLPVPFGGGAIGFFAYELGGTLERLPAPRAPLLSADMVVGFYDVIAAFDHRDKQAWVISTGLPARDEAKRHARAATRAQMLAAALGTTAPLAEKTWTAHWQQETPRAMHESKVADVIEFIRAGDIFQANLTHRFSADTPVGLDWLALYMRLRAAAPAPFGTFFNAGENMYLLSASPERFLSLTADGHVETRPIKGTRPRGTSKANDERLATELKNSAKDRSENLMIVDLLRNDLARVCQPGSIAVPVLHGLESFPAVHHLVSVVTGELRAHATAIDLLRACFPGGSVTGAPKIRAMEVIHELEAGPRGPYCGTIAWLGFDGAMDSSIVIRALIGDEHKIYAQAGGGIVADSNPAQEYDESITKAAPMLAALTEHAP